MSSLPLAARSERTFARAATETLEGLWEAVHGGHCPTDVRALVSTMMGGWGANLITDAPEWRSDIGNDHSPFEFSAVLTPGAPELRFLVEAQGNAPTFQATREACLQLNESLAQRGADLRRFNQVRDLFLPKVRHARFALWHAVALTAGPLRAKAYLNPQIRGAQQAGALVKSALERLDMQAAWSTIAEALPAGAMPGEELRYFALDLQQSAKARVKIYFYLEEATAEDLERVAGLRPGYVAGEVTEFCNAIAGSVGPYGARPPSVYLAFTGNDATPSEVTVQIPIAFHAADDSVASDRVRLYLRSHGLDTRTYDRALHAVTARPLTAGRGLHAYVSLRTGTTPARVTTYFAAELHGVQEPMRSARRIRLGKDA